MIGTSAQVRRQANLDDERHDTQADFANRDRTRDADFANRDRTREERFANAQDQRMVGHAPDADSVACRWPAVH